MMFLILAVWVDSVANDTIYLSHQPLPATYRICEPDGSLVDFGTVTNQRIPARKGEYLYLVEDEAFLIEN